MHLRRNRRWYVRSMHAWCAHPSLPTTLTPSPSRCRQAHRRRANPNPSPLTRTRTLTLTLTLTLSGAARHTAAGRHADGPRRLVSHHRNWPRGGLGLGAESRRPGAHWHQIGTGTVAARGRRGPGRGRVRSVSLGALSPVTLALATQGRLGYLRRQSIEFCGRLIKGRETHRSPPRDGSRGCANGTWLIFSIFWTEAGCALDAAREPRRLAGLD